MEEKMEKFNTAFAGDEMAKMKEQLEKKEKRKSPSVGAGNPEDFAKAESLEGQGGFQFSQEIIEEYVGKDNGKKKKEKEERLRKYADEIDKLIKKARENNKEIDEKAIVIEFMSSKRAPKLQDAIVAHFNKENREKKDEREEVSQDSSTTKQDSAGKKKNSEEEKFISKKEKRFNALKSLKNHIKKEISRQLKGRGFIEPEMMDEMASKMIKEVGRGMLSEMKIRKKGNITKEEAEELEVLVKEYLEDSMDEILRLIDSRKREVISILKEGNLDDDQKKNVKLFLIDFGENELIGLPGIKKELANANKEIKDAWKERNEKGSTKSEDEELKRNFQSYIHAEIIDVLEKRGEKPMLEQLEKRKEIAKEVENSEEGRKIFQEVIIGNIKLGETRKQIREIVEKIAIRPVQEDSHKKKKEVLTGEKKGAITEELKSFLNIRIQSELSRREKFLEFENVKGLVNKIVNGKEGGELKESLHSGENSIGEPEFLKKIEKLVIKYLTEELRNNFFELFKFEEKDILFYEKCEEFARKFMRELEKNVDWEGYTEKQKQQALLLQTEVFIGEYVGKNPKFKNHSGKIIEELINGMR